ncbi:MAG: hypothetical protein COB02_03230 [Candidatus Cloacimonadota bacterium]|nr:MAG: hypothetical protein COB02_03230 [Candidatus Cloacimonadota bacterium]
MELKIEEWIPEISKETAKEFIVSSFYSKGKLTSKVAYDIIGASRIEFSDILEKHGFDICTDVDEDDLSL